MRDIAYGSKASGPAGVGYPMDTHRLRRRKLGSPVILFLLALVVPWVIFIGPLRASLYRLVLLVMILPCLGMWISGKAGRIRLPDMALVLFSLWCSLSFVVNNGFAP